MYHLSPVNSGDAGAPPALHKHINLQPNKNRAYYPVSHSNGLNTDSARRCYDPQGRGR